MASADMNRLMDQARLRLPGALDGAIQMELFNALDELFKGSNCWYEDVEFTVQPTTRTYREAPDDYVYILVPTSGSIFRLVGVWDEGGAPVEATMPAPPDVLIRRAPLATEDYLARVVLTVVDPTTRDGYPQFPDWVLRKYGSVILDGLLGRMMAQIAKPYSNAQMAALHLRKFRSDISKAKVEAQRQNVYRAQAWKFPQTFNRL